MSFVAILSLIFCWRYKCFSTTSCFKFGRKVFWLNFYRPKEISYYKTLLKNYYHKYYLYFEGMKNLESLIKTYNDFPQKGIAFKDILGIIQDPEVFREITLKMSSNKLIKNAEAIISIEARGFIFGSAISLQASKPMLVARKPGKLPGKLIKENYDLEYGKNSLSIQKEAIKKFNSYVIVDDLLATGGTIQCVANLIRKSGKDVCGSVTVVELIELNGRSRFDFPMDSLISL